MEEKLCLKKRRLKIGLKRGHIRTAWEYDKRRRDTDNRPRHKEHQKGRKAAKNKGYEKDTGADTGKKGSMKGAKPPVAEAELSFLKAFCYLADRFNMGDKSLPRGSATSPAAPNIVLDFSQFLAAQCPLPGQPGAPCFDGKEVSRFVRSWERFSERYRLTKEKMVQ